MEVHMSGINLRWAILGALPATFMLAAMPATDLAPVSGKFTMKYSQQHALPVSDAAGPVLLANEAKGSNSNTGRTDYMNGATVTSVEIADLTQGNGQHQGYVTFAKDGETSVSRWNGRVSTTLSADKQPITTFEGTWTKVGGTGRYEGVSGKGRYKGRMLSPTEYVVAWDGNLNLKDKTASR
jgi:hypothetical protein